MRAFDSFRVTLPPPAPLPRFSALPSFPGGAPVDDADPTRPWVEGLDDPPTARRAPTPARSWAPARVSPPDALARSAPTVRPPSAMASRLPVALHGFAAGIACGAIGLLVMWGLDAIRAPAAAARAGAAAASAVVAPAAAPAAPVAAARVRKAAFAPVVRVEDLPRAAVRVDELPAAGCERGRRGCTVL